MSKPFENSKPDLTSAPPADRDGTAFPIVGIGASAGGLEALEQFLGNIQPDSGMAFVVIQHLDPRHRSMMPTLLQRATKLPVRQIADHTSVESNQVYVVPPGKYLTLMGRVLYLIEPVEPHSQQLPIDYFFRALADEEHERAIGVVLSGTGSDGTLGLQAIRENAGLTLVQAPESAKFDGMPRSAIDAGLADIVAPAQELAEKLLNYGRRGFVAPLKLSRKSALDKIFNLLRTQTGHDFSLYKKGAMYRRIRRRIGLRGIEGIDDYVRFLDENPDEVSALFKELLIGETRFFRDPQAWAQLVDTALPALLARYPVGKALRAWVIGCSTGEEAYSLAIAFREALERRTPPVFYSLQIFATDPDAEAIERARQAFYPPNIATDVSPERLAHFFVPEDNGYRVRKEIREMVVFASQNIITDPPFTKLDLLSCRNLLTYLSTDLQKKLSPLFHYSLVPGGILFLGNNESVANPDLFEPLGDEARLFQRREVTPHPIEVEFPSALHATSSRPAKPGGTPEGSVDIEGLAEQLLLEHFAPAAVLVNGDGDILYISGHTGKYLELAAGNVKLNVYAMARQGLREELNAALPDALHTRETVVRRGVRVGTNGGSVLIDLIVMPLPKPAELAGTAVVVFADIRSPAREKAAGKQQPSRNGGIEVQHASQQGREASLTSREGPKTLQEMRTSCQELTATNETLQSANEDLQSVNEELTTSKEELQSLNETLQTENAELHARVDVLSTDNKNMRSLLESIDLATVFLNDKLCVRRFTPQATRLFKLLPTDIGRPLSDVVTDLVYPTLQDDAREVLRSLVFREKLVSAKDGRHFIVKLMPHRTPENRIEGLVMTFTGVDNIKGLGEK